MNGLSRLGLAPWFALFLVVLALPVAASAETVATHSQAVADTIPPTDAAAPDSVQSEAMPDSVQAPTSTPAATPPPASAPAPGIAPAAGAAGTTTTPPAAAPSTTTTPPASTAPSAAAQTTPPPAAAQSTAPAARKEPFTKGTTRVSITGGWGRTFDEDYLMLGIGAGRFIANGLNIGLDLEAWMLGDPGIFKISPNVNYVLAGRGRRMKPYVGGFWRRTMVENADDLSSVGGRAGAYFKGAGPLMIGGGGVWENYLDCNDDIYQNCSQVYPEFVISASF
jgi:hypothetical protein